MAVARRKVATVGPGAEEAVGVRSAMVLVVAVVAGLVLVGPAAAGPTGTVAPSGGARTAIGDDVCRAASTLVADGRPVDAQELVAGVAPHVSDPCLTRVETRAAEAIDEADALAQDARELVATDPSGARTKAEDALEKDQDNVAATEVLADLAPASPLETADTAWRKLVSGVLTPAGSLLLPVAGVLLATLVLGRLAVLLPMRRRRVSTKQQRWWATVLASALVLASGTILAFGLGGLDGLTRVVVAVLGVVAASWLVAYVLATRLRVAVQVHDSTGTLDEAATGHVVALLAEIGGDRPRGLDVPRGADVSALDGSAISGLPKSTLVGLFTTGLQLVAGLTPWRIRVDEESGDRVAISVTRNGRSVAAGVADRDELGLRTPRSQPAVGSGDDTTSLLPDLHPFAAAMAIIEMSRAYDGFDGLCGASDWRGLGLTEVAHRYYGEDAKDTRTRISVLSRALGFDPENISAAAALHHARYRKATSVPDLERYLTLVHSLLERLGDRPATRPMRARLLLSWLIAATNLDAARTRAEAAAAAGAGPGVPDPRHVAVRLIRLLDTMKADGVVSEHGVFADRMKPSAASVYLSVPRGWAAPPGLVCTSEREGTDDVVRLSWSGGSTDMVAWFAASQERGPSTRHREVGWQYTPWRSGPQSTGDGRMTGVVALPEHARRFFYVGVAPGRQRGGTLTGRPLSAAPIPGREAPLGSEVPPDVLATAWVRDRSTFDPRSLYNYACRPTVPEAEAVEALRVPLLEPAYRRWAGKDPALARLVAADGFQDLLVPQDAELTELALVSPHADALEVAGLARGSALARTDRRHVGRLLDIDELAAGYLCDIAGLWEAIPEDRALLKEMGRPRLRRLRDQVLAALLDEGVGSAADLRARSSPTVAAGVREAVQVAVGPNVVTRRAGRCG